MTQNNHGMAPACMVVSIMHVHLQALPLCGHAMGEKRYV
jgi:hypothetical protein